MAMARIEIVSGEGEQGTRETYRGPITVAALARRMAKERAGGDCWVRVEVDGQRMTDAADAVRAVRAAADSAKAEGK